MRRRWTLTADVARVHEYPSYQGRERQFSEILEGHKLNLGNVVGGPEASANNLAQTVDDDPVLIRRVDDFIHTELTLHVDLKTSFLLQLTRRSLGDTLKRMNLAAGQNPAPSLRILVSLAQQDSVRLIPNDECGTDSRQCFAHNAHRVPIVAHVLMEHRQFILAERRILWARGAPGVLAKSPYGFVP